MAICCVSEKIQTAHQPNTLHALDFFASLHLTIFERPANFFVFLSNQPDPAAKAHQQGSAQSLLRTGTKASSKGDASAGIEAAAPKTPSSVTLRRRVFSFSDHC